MKLSFREQNIFSKIRDNVFVNDDHFSEFQWMLIKNPEVGDRIPGGGGLRKVRFNDPSRGRGTRGGIRVIYAYYEDYATVLLLFAYDKNLPDITPVRKKILAELSKDFADQLKEETK